MLGNPPIILSITSLTVVDYSFLIPIQYLLFLYSFIAADYYWRQWRNNAYILPAQIEAHHHRHNFNHNNLSYL